MTIRRILRIDNAEDRKILKAPCLPVQLPDPSLKSLVDDMFETMHDANGVGLAAPQVGISIQLAIIEIPPAYRKRPDGKDEIVEPAVPYVLINPRITKIGEGEIMRNEGCLSLPGYYGDVPRAHWVAVEFQDLKGRNLRLRRADGLLGWSLQHEIDHLNGILFTERILDLTTLCKVTKYGKQPIALETIMDQPSA